MANTVLIKRSGTANAVPLAGNLVAGELAINYADGKLYFLGSGGAVTQIAGNSSMTFSGNVSAGNILTGGIISATGTITSNAATNATGFAVGNSAVSNVALGMFPTAGTAGEYAIRDYSNVFTNMYFDVGMGGTANGAFQFRTSNSFRLLANVNSTGISTPFAVSATGNVSGNYFIGNGSQLTGIVASAGTNITNGTSNVVVAASGNVTVGVAGTAAVATFTTAGIIANSVAASNNGAGTNFKVGDDTWLGDINLSDTLSVRGQQNAANAYIVFGNADATALGRAGSGPLTYGGAFSASGNITGGNISATNHTGTAVSVTANVTGGNILTGGIISATGNVSGGNVAAATAIFSLGTVGASGNVSGGNISTVGNVTGNYILGNGALLTGVITSVANINNGTSNVTVVSSGGNVTVGIGGTGNVAVFATTGEYVTGVVSASGNVTGGNLLTAGIISATGNIRGGNVAASSYYYANGVAIINYTSATTPPASPSTGWQWYNTLTDVLYEYITDGTTPYWVDVSSPAFSNGPAGNMSLGGSLLPNANITYDLGSSTNRWKDLWLAGTTLYLGDAVLSASGTSVSLGTGNVTGGNITTAGIVSAAGNITAGNLTVSTGTVTLGNVVNANGNGVGNIGSSSNYFNTVFGKATTAQYADLAENYLGDAEYAPGTVLDFDGEQEVTLSTRDSSKRVAGVVSTNPAHLMNSTLNGAYVTAVALTGRVPTLVTGKIAKGDLMVSAGNGRARSEPNPSVGTVIGKSLENFDGVEGTIEIVISMQ